MKFHLLVTVVLVLFLSTLLPVYNGQADLYQHEYEDTPSVTWSDDGVRGLSSYMLRNGGSNADDIVRALGNNADDVFRISSRSNVLELSDDALRAINSKLDDAARRGIPREKVMSVVIDPQDRVTALAYLDEDRFIHLIDRHELDFASKFGTSTNQEIQVLVENSVRSRITGPNPPLGGINYYYEVQPGKWMRTSTGLDGRIITSSPYSGNVPGVP